MCLLIEIKFTYYVLKSDTSPCCYPRSFVEKNYKELKTLNPKLPILIRECSGVEPQLWARYGITYHKSHFMFYVDLCFSCHGCVFPLEGPT